MGMKKAIQLRQARRNARPASIARGVSSTEMITEHKTRQWKRSPRTKKKKQKQKQKQKERLGYFTRTAGRNEPSPSTAPEASSARRMHHRRHCHHRRRHHQYHRHLRLSLSGDHTRAQRGLRNPSPPPKKNRGASIWVETHTLREIHKPAMSHAAF